MICRIAGHSLRHLSFNSLRRPDWFRLAATPILLPAVNWRKMAPVATVRVELTGLSKSVLPNIKPARTWFLESGPSDHNGSRTAGNLHRMRRARLANLTLFLAALFLPVRPMWSGQSESPQALAGAAGIPSNATPGPRQRPGIWALPNPSWRQFRRQIHGNRNGDNSRLRQCAGGRQPPARCSTRSGALPAKAGDQLV